MTVYVPRLFCVSQEKLGFVAITNKPPNLKGFMSQRFDFLSHRIQSEGGNFSGHLSSLW